MTSLWLVSLCFSFVVCNLDCQYFNPYKLEKLIDTSNLIVRASLVDPPSPGDWDLFYGPYTADVRVHCTLKGTVKNATIAENGDQIIRVEGFLDLRHRCTYLFPNNFYILLIGFDSSAPDPYRLHFQGTQPDSFTEKEIVDLTGNGDCSIPPETPAQCHCPACDDVRLTNIEKPPWQAIIWDVELNESICDAIMIDCDLFLTSASCSDGYEHAQLQVRTLEDPVDFGLHVHSISPHPKYEEKKEFNVALLRLHTGACHASLKPVCLVGKETILKKERLVLYHAPDESAMAKKVHCLKVNFAFLKCWVVDGSEIAPAFNLMGSSLVAESKENGNRSNVWTVLGIFKYRVNRDLWFTRVNRAPIHRWIDDQLRSGHPIDPVKSFDQLVTQVEEVKAAIVDEGKSIKVGNGIDHSSGDGSGGLIHNRS